MYLKLRTLLLPFFVMVFSVFATAVQAQTYTEPNLPTVTSDKDDYAPGEVAHITGTGWTLDQQVHVEFKEEPDYPDYHIYDITVGINGTWKVDYQVEERHLKVKFTVNALGKQSSFTATTVFFDGRAEISAVSPSPFSPSVSIGLKDIVKITGLNNSAIGSNNNIANFNVRIKNSNGDFVWRSADQSINNGTSKDFDWDGTYSSAFGSGFVPEGVYTAIAFNNNTESSSPPSITKTIIVDKTAPNVSNINRASGATNPTNATSVIYRVTFSEAVTGVDASDFSLNKTGTADGTIGSPVVVSGTNGTTYDVTVTSVTGNGNLRLDLKTTGTGIIDVADNSISAGFTTGQTYTIDNTIATTLNVPNVTGTYGGTVTISATISPAVSGKTITFSLNGTALSPTATTNSSGIATLSNVSISAINASTIAYSNAITAQFSGDENYKPSNGSGDMTVDKASSTTVVTIAAGPFTYTGSPITPATVKVTGAGGLNLTPDAGYANNTNAGTATASYTYAGDDNHEGSTDSETFSIGKASSTTVVTIAAGPFTYTGSPITPATVKVTGAGGLNLTPDAGYANNTNAGTATASYTYAGDDNHEGSTDSETFSIGKASSTTVVTIAAGPFTYTGSPITPATVKVTGAGGLNLTPDAGYANNTNAGTATASYTYAGDDNHEGSTDSETFSIGKASSTTVVTIAAGPFTYTGSPITPATVKVTGAGGLNLTPDAGYANNTNAGTATASYTYAGDDNHEGSTDSETFSIGKASSTTVVTIAAGPFTYTGSPITPATVKVTGAGGLNLTPDAGYANNTNAGTATASYTYAGDDNHEGSTDSETFSIGKASSTTVVTIAAGPFTYTGSPITPATVKVTGAGGLNLTPDAGYANNTNAGTATASYTYAGDDNHEGSTDSETFSIGKASSTTVVTIAAGPFTYTGSPITPATVKVTGAGGLNLTPDAGYANNTNAGTATASYTYAGDDNHEGSTDSETFSIGKASSTTVVTIAAGPFTYTGSPITPATVKVTGAGGLNLTPDAGYANNTNAGTATASYTYAGDDNHEGSTDSETFSIGKASSTTVVTIAAGPFTYTGSPITPATVKVTGAGGLNLTPDAGYANNTNAGTATASYTYAGDDNHEGSTDSETFSIGKASSTTVVTIAAGPFTYTGSPITPATVKVTGAGGLNLTPDAGYANNTNAGTATASYTYAGDDNHEGSTDSETFSIGKASPTVTATAATDLEYSGTAKAGSGSATGVGTPAEVLTPVTLSYVGTGSTSYGPSATAPTNAGTYTITASFAGNSNYNSASSNALAFTITKAPLTITANNASKYCGQPNPTNIASSYSSKNNETFYITYSINGTVITPSSTDSKLSNYNVQFKDGILTIIGTSIDATASNKAVPINTASTLTAIITSIDGSAIAGVSVTFKLDGVEKGTAITADGTSGTTKGVATLSIPGLGANVYYVEAITAGNCGKATAYLTVYDPNGGFVTGGGWILSPRGAYVQDQALEGKASFGFIAKYRKGSTSIIDGETEFQFHAGNLNFKSSSNDAMSLVIAGAKAVYKGQGTINGVAGYSFMVSAIDGNLKVPVEADKFRIKIWNAAGPVYDNQMGALDNADATTILGGGSIVIHSDAKKTTSQQAITMGALIEESTDTKFGLTAFPNPTQDHFKIHVESSNRNEKIMLRVFDASGRVVRLIRDLTAGQTITLGNEYRPGVYFVEMVQGKDRKQVKLLKVVH